MTNKAQSGFPSRGSIFVKVVVAEDWNGLAEGEAVEKTREGKKAEECQPD